MYSLIICLIGEFVRRASLEKDGDDCDDSDATALPGGVEVVLVGAVALDRRVVLVADEVTEHHQHAKDERKGSEAQQKPRRGSKPNNQREETFSTLRVRAVERETFSEANIVNAR